MKPVFRNCVLFVSDVKRSAQFYTNVFAQEIEYDFGINIGFKSGLSLWEMKDYLPVSKQLGKERLKKTGIEVSIIKGIINQ